MKYHPFALDVKPAARERGKEFEHAETWCVAARALEFLFEIGARASDGEKDAAEFLVGIASHAATELAATAAENIPLFQKIAETRPQWPVNASRHPENERANQNIFQQLHLGEKAAISAKENSHWTRENVATVYAGRIIETLDYNRSIFPVLKYSKDNTPIPQWVAEAATLPKLSKATAAAWWSVGRECFCEVVPHPEKVPELFKLVRLEQKHRQRSKILEKIGRAFRNMAAD